MRNGTINGGDVVRVLLAVIMAGTGFGQAIPLSNEVHSACVAAVDVFDLIDRKSALDPFDSKGKKPEKVDGQLQFNQVRFAYPTRPQVMTLSQSGCAS